MERVLGRAKKATCYIKPSLFYSCTFNYNGRAIQFQSSSIFIQTVWAMICARGICIIIELIKQSQRS